MNEKSIDIKDIITILIGIISIIIPSYFLFMTSPDEIKNQMIIVFTSIIIILIIGTVISYIYNQWIRLNHNVKINKNKIEKLEKDLKGVELSFKLDKRIAIMENLIDKFINKKAQLQIDPRIIIWIALIILLLLFLKTAGVFG